MDRFWGALDSMFGPTVRAYYAKKYGTCRVCTRPLGGESPEKICVECHAAEALAMGFAHGLEHGDAEGPDA